MNPIYHGVVQKQDARTADLVVDSPFSPFFPGLPERCLFCPAETRRERLIPYEVSRWHGQQAAPLRQDFFIQFFAWLGASQKEPRAMFRRILLAMLQSCCTEPPSSIGGRWNYWEKCCSMLQSAPA